MSAPGTAVVELLFFAGCPGYQEVLGTVERLTAQAGAQLVLRAVETPEHAEAERFLGSPTVRVNGADVEPGAAERDDVGLECRLYRWDGSHLRVPPEDGIRTALSTAAANR